MKITLEPGGSFPPSPLVQANIRAALQAAMIAVDDAAPDLFATGGLTAWFDTNTGEIKFYDGVTAVPFKFRNAIISSTPPADPVPGLEWFNSTDGITYTWYDDTWVASESTLSFGVYDLLTLFRSTLVSDEPPTNPTNGTQWFRTTDGFVYTWYQNAWVAGEAALPPELSDVLLELDAKAPKEEIITITAQYPTIADAHANAYLRFTNSSAKIYTVEETPNMPVGTKIILRNAAASNLSVLAVNTTLNAIAGHESVVPQGRIELRKVASDTWDLIKLD